MSHRFTLKSVAHSICFFLFAVFIAESVSAQNMPRVVHVFVALADNDHQGIVPVPKVLGNGDDANRNLYWGAGFGVRTFFKKSADWQQVGETLHLSPYVLERIIFRNKTSETYLVADAYRGSAIRQSLTDFFSATAGLEPPIRFDGPKESAIHLNRKAELFVYIGHDGLMDFSIEKVYRGESTSRRQAIILACASKQYFRTPLKPTGAEPLLWTTNLMAPEAYTLKAALDGWIAGETDEQIRQRAALAYAQYQKISTVAALKLFATGW